MRSCITLHCCSLASTAQIKYSPPRSNLFTHTPPRPLCAVFDYRYTAPDGQIMNKLVFLNW